MSVREHRDVSDRRPAKVSYLMRCSDDGTHRLGVNALAIHDASGRMITAGRDADIRVWRTTEDAPRCVACAEGHADWVNDVVITTSGDTVVSCSNDTTVRIWRIDEETDGVRPTHTLSCHQDYARCLAYAPGKDKVVSAGLDQKINVIDLATGEVSWENEVPNKGDDGRSIYSVATDPALRLIATGSPDKVIRFWDERTGKACFELKGHTDNVRALLLKADATTCLSGSSDNSVRLWDIRQRSCVRQSTYHQDSVWAIAADQDLQRIVTGGRDGNVYEFDPVQDTHVPLVSGVGPVVALALGSDSSQIWLAGNAKSPVVGRWSLEAARTAHAEGTVEEPEASITVVPGIVKCQILNDRQHVLSQDSDGFVSQWHVATASMVRDFGKDVDFESTVQDLTKLVSVPSWFTVAPCASGLAVTLEKSTAFAADVPLAHVTGVSDEALEGAQVEDPVNLGSCTTRALFRGWLEGQEEGDSQDMAPSHRQRSSFVKAEVRGNVPSHIFQGLEERTVLTVVPGGCSTPSLIKRVGELDGEEREIPDWVSACLTIGPVQNKPVRIAFSLRPLEGSCLPALEGAQLTANNSLLMGKTYVFIVEKLKNVKELKGRTEPACELVDLFCNGKLVTVDLTLAAVQECLWRNRPVEGQAADLLLQYDLHPVPRGSPRTAGRS